MPTGILVVKRPRGGPFAAVRGVPAWLRAISTSLFRRESRRSPDAMVGAPERSAGRSPVDSAMRGRAEASAGSPLAGATPADAVDALERLRTGLVERGARMVDGRPGQGGIDAAGAPAAGPSIVEVDEASASAVLRWLRDEPALSFDVLFDLTVVDRLPASPRFEVDYSLRSSATGRSLRVRRSIEADPPEVDSVVALWRNADWLEREAWDLFGVRFRAHPGLDRILLSPDFEGAPLRRDFGRSGGPAEVAPA